MNNTTPMLNLGWQLERGLAKTRSSSFAVFCGDGSTDCTIKGNHNLAAGTGKGMQDLGLAHQGKIQQNDDM